MKHIKKILCLSLAVLLCFSLIGCNAIDNKRKVQIHYNEEENLVYDGKEYKLLPECSAFSPDMTHTQNLFLTEEDLPVLLSEIFGISAYLTKDKLFISTDAFTYSDSKFAIYARSDIFDSIAARIKSGDYFDGFCFCYSYWDENGNYNETYKIISEEAEKAVKEIISTGTPDEEIDIDLLYTYEVTDLRACSNDLLFNEYSATIYKTEKYIYITAFTGLNKEQVFKVSEEYYDAINEIVESYYSFKELYDNYSLPEDF